MLIQVDAMPCQACFIHVTVVQRLECRLASIPGASC